MITSERIDTYKEVFPIIKIHSNRYIVLFDRSGWGTVLNSPTHPIGEYCCNWNDEFSPYAGEIVLSNPK